MFFADRDFYCTGYHESSESAESCMDYSRPVYKPIDVVRFYSEFNELLFKAMQGKESAIERMFAKTFIGQEKTEELHEFFQNFKISSFDE